MPYRYTFDTKNDQLVFTRLGAGCARFIFVFVGFIFTLVGICLIIYAKSDEEIFTIIKFVMPAFGLVFMCVGIRLPKIQGRNTPDRMIFDNEKGRIEITQQDSDIKTAYIYYDEIADFIIKVKSHSSSSNTGRTYNDYHIYLAKKDGGTWELLKSTSNKAAQEEISKLKGLIKLDRTSQRVAIHLKDSQKYTLSEGIEKSELTWRNKLGYGPLVLILFAGIFLTVLYAIVSNTFSLSDSLPIFAYFVVGFIGLVFLLVIGGNAWKMIKNSKTEYVISITSHSLDYIERGLDGIDKKSTRIAMSELHSIALSFDSDATQRAITIYTHQQFQQKDTIGTSLSIAAIKDAFHFHQELLVLDFQDMTAVEALQIEHYLKQQITKKGTQATT